MRAATGGAGSVGEQSSEKRGRVAWAWVRLRLRAAKKAMLKAGRGQQKSGAGEASERARERGSAVSGREFARKAEP